MTVGPRPERRPPAFRRFGLRGRIFQPLGPTRYRMLSDLLRTPVLREGRTIEIEKRYAEVTPAGMHRPAGWYLVTAAEPTGVYAGSTAAAAALEADRYARRTYRPPPGRQERHR